MFNFQNVFDEFSENISVILFIVYLGLSTFWENQLCYDIYYAIFSTWLENIKVLDENYFIIYLLTVVF